MISQHLGKALSEQQRSHWVRLICQSADDAGLPDDPEFRAAFVAYLEWGSRRAKENSTSDAAT
jgi:hemoglobin